MGKAQEECTRWFLGIFGARERVQCIDLALQHQFGKDTSTDVLVQLPAMVRHHTIPPRVVLVARRKDARVHRIDALATSGLQLGIILADPERPV